MCNAQTQVILPSVVFVIFVRYCNNLQDNFLGEKKVIGAHVLKMVHPIEKIKAPLASEGGPQQLHSFIRTIGYFHFFARFTHFLEKMLISRERILLAETLLHFHM